MEMLMFFNRKIMLMFLIINVFISKAQHYPGFDLESDQYAFLKRDSTVTYLYDKENPDVIIKMDNESNYSLLRKGRLEIKGKIWPYRRDNVLFPTGIWTVFYDNGNKKFTREYMDGVKIGVWTSYDSLGNKIKDEYYGVIEKDSITNKSSTCLYYEVSYYKNGKEKEKGNYKAVLGKIVFEIYDESNGKIDSSYRVDYVPEKYGEWYYFDENGRLLKTLRYE